MPLLLVYYLGQGAEKINISPETIDFGFSAYSLGYINERHYKKLQQIESSFYDYSEQRAFQVLFDENLINQAFIGIGN